jgi:hypothetical protein
MHFSQYILALLPLAAATHLRISIPPSTSLHNRAVLPPSTHASLTTLNKRYTAPLRIDHSFDFPNVTAGSYLLDVNCHSHGFGPLRVDVHEKAAAQTDSETKEVSVWGTFRGNEWANKGEVVEVSKSQGIWWFEVQALGVKEYLQPRPGCEYCLLESDYLLLG